jgi:membrane protein CcdC involved in cytochrome C biogenesis
MGHSFSASLPITSTFGMVVFAFTIIILRLRATKRPVSVAKIIMPPIGMSSGFLMFLFTPMRIPTLWALAAFAVGVIFFSYPLILTSKFERVGNEIFLRRSKAFIVILVAILLVRVLLHSYVEQWITISQTAALFFILAFGMLLPWRVVMYLQYQKLRKG